MLFHIGHPAYHGVNALKSHKNKHGAVLDLIDRGVPPTIARNTINRAIASPREPFLCNTKHHWVIEVAAY